MFTSMSALTSGSTGSISNSFTSTETESKKVLIAPQNLEEKIPLLAEGEAEKKLAATLTQVQQNEVSQLNFTGFGQFFEGAEPVHTFNEQESAVTSLAVLKNGVLASGSGYPEFSIKLWNLSSYSCFKTLSGHTDYVLALAVLPNGSLASGSDDNTIKLWDLSSYSCFKTLSGHTYSVYALSVLSNGSLASASWDKTIKLWDLSSYSCIATLTGHTSAVLALAVLPNGRLASGSWDNTIKLWDLSSYSCFKTLSGHTSDVWALAVLPNGSLASASSDHTIKLWDLSSYSCFKTLSGHTYSVYALAVLSNGSLASGSDDNTIKLWDLSSYSCFKTLSGHTNWVQALAVLPNGSLASGSGDGTIKLWDPKIVSLSAKHLQPILKALKTNTSITDLNLSGLPQITDDIIDPLIALFTSRTTSDAKPNTTLKTIDLRQTGVTKTGVETLEQAIESLPVIVSSDYKTIFHSVLQTKSAAVFSAFLEKASVQSVMSAMPDDRRFVIHEAPLQTLTNLGVLMDYLKKNHQPIPMSELVLEAIPDTTDKDLWEALLKSLVTIFQTCSQLTIRCPLSSAFESLVNQAAAKTEGRCTLRILEVEPFDEKSSGALCTAPFLSRLIAQIPDTNDQKEEKPSPLTIRLRHGAFVPGVVWAHSRLQEIDFTGNAISAEEAKSLREPLSQCPQLKRLVLDRVNLPQAILEWVALFTDLKQLKKLSCQSQRWTDASLNVFLNYLAFRPQIEQLDLRSSSLSNSQMRGLIEVIRDYNLQLTDCALDVIPQELQALLQRNRQKEALEKQWQSHVSRLDAHQAKLNEMKRSTVRITDEELKIAEQEVTQAILELQALEKQHYPLRSDKRNRSSDYHGFFLNWVEAWGLVGKQQETVDNLIYYYKLAFQMQEKYAPHDQVLLKKIYSSYLQALVQFQKTSDYPFYHFEVALWVSEEAVQKQIPGAAEWVKACYRHYFEALTQKMTQAPEEKTALDYAFRALKLWRIAKAKSGSLAPDHQSSDQAQIARALYLRPQKSLYLLEKALSIAEQAEKEQELRARETLETIHETYIQGLSQLALEAKDCGTALRHSQELLLKVQDTKARGFSHRPRSLALCQETFLKLVERYQETDGQEEAMMGLLEYVPPISSLKSRFDAVALVCSKRYLQKKISDYMVKHCGSFARSVSHFPEDLGAFQVSLKLVKSHAELVEKVKQFLESSQKQYSTWYWQEVFNDLREILSTIAKLAILKEAYEKEGSSATFYASATPSLSVFSRPIPSAPLASESNTSSSSGSDHKESKESKETKKMPEVVLPKRPKGETIRDHLNYLTDLGVDVDRLEIPDKYHDIMIDVFSQSIMEDPVMASDGHTYNREQLVAFLNRSADPISPHTRVRLNKNVVIENISARGFIINFLDQKIAERIEEMKKAAQEKALKEQQALSQPYFALSSSSQSMFSSSSSAVESSQYSSFSSSSSSSFSSTNERPSSTSFLTSTVSSTLFFSGTSDRISIPILSPSVSASSSSSQDSCEPSAPIWRARD